MNTSQLLELYAQAISATCGQSLVTLDLETFTKRLVDANAKIAEQLSPEFSNVSALKSDAMARLMERVFLDAVRGRGPQQWDRDYVRSTYGSLSEGCDFVYYPARHAKRLIVNFSSMGKNRFDRYSRHWDPLQQWDGDTAYLFFKDDDFTYFLGTDATLKSDAHVRIIRRFAAINGLTEKQIFTVGGSMGGYGALYYALRMGLQGAIVCAPQTTMRGILAHQMNNWERNARSTGTQWVDLDMYVHRAQATPYVYIEYGRYAADVIAAEAVLSELSKKPSLTIVRRAGWIEHTVDTVLSKETIDQVVTLFESQVDQDANFA